jgi:hypothetical protein
MHDFTVVEAGSKDQINLHLQNKSDSNCFAKAIHHKDKPAKTPLLRSSVATICVKQLLGA